MVVWNDAWHAAPVCVMLISAELCCRDRLFAEIRVLKQLKHKNIMTFYDSWLDQKTYSVNFITEMFTSGTLRQYASDLSTVGFHLLGLSNKLQHTAGNTFLTAQIVIISDTA